MHNSLCVNKDKIAIEICHKGVSKLYQVVSTFVSNAQSETFRVK